MPHMSNYAVYNVYCDESCHLEHDGHAAMVLGAVWCPLDKSREVSARISDIKNKHRLAPEFEIKWNKVSPAKLEFYSDLIDYFFDNGDLHFRGYIANKRNLDHSRFNQDHDTWYYKMYFHTLAHILRPHARYRFYFDRKDTHSGAKLKKLHEVLCNNAYDFRKEIIERVQAVHSHEVAQIQLADLLIGCLGFANRTSDHASSAKNALVERVAKRSGHDLTRSTLPREEKFNVFHWGSQSE